MKLYPGSMGALVLLFSLTTAGAVPLAAAQPEFPFVPGRLLVKFRASAGETEKQNVFAAVRGRSIRQISGIGVHVVEVPANSEKALQNLLKSHKDVEAIELDRIVPHADITPNDPMYSSEWHLKKISASTAWSITTGSTSITIAVLDTGVDGTHEDLAAQMVPGWNFFDGNSDTRDIYGHGTSVAGVVAASSNNSRGVSSIAWNCRILPIRVSDLSGNASYSAISDGLVWAADNGARVANISYAVSGSATVAYGANYFQNKGGVVAVSAGNYGSFDSSADNPTVLTVSATDPNDVLYSWSNTGNNIDFSAPGCVYTTVRGGGYASACGTSFSAPIVAGVAALVLSAKPSISSAELIRVLQQSADDLGPAGWDPTFGWGRINAARAVSMVAGPPPADTQPPTVSFTSPANATTVSGTVSVLVSAQDNVGVASVKVMADGLPICALGTQPYSCSWNTAGRPNGAHTLTATALDAAGNAGSASTGVTVNNVITLDTTPPTITIVFPTQGSRVAGNLIVKVDANDNVGVIKVELFVDGARVGTSTIAPFGISWSPKKGTSSLQSRAYDGAGNVAYSQIVSVSK